MNFIEKESWTEQDILDIIAAKTEESIHVDFKASGALTKKDGNTSPKAEITKDVSAFANSDGGLIFYGIVEKGNVADSLDFINGNEFTKEWLEQIITGGIYRAIPGLRIYPVRFNEDITKTVYVVRIPSSLEAPHMNKDKKFYRRYNFESVAMEEYEVRNLYSRSTHPELGFVKAEVRASDMNLGFGIIQKAEFLRISVTIKNIGNGLADKYKVAFKMNSAYQKGIYEAKTVQVTQSDRHTIISSTETTILFPDEKLTVLAFTFEVHYLGIKSIDKEPCIITIYYQGGMKEVKLDIFQFFSGACLKAVQTGSKIEIPRFIPPPTTP